MKRLLALAMTVLPLLSGCAIFNTGPDTAVKFHADTAFSPPERECLNESADIWRNQTNGFADIKIEYDYDSSSVLDRKRHTFDNRLIRWTSKTPVVVEMENERSTPTSEYILLGQVNSISVNDPLHRPIEMRMVMDRLQDKHDCLLTGVHEFGHVFGLEHNPWNRSAIMYPSVNHARTACLKKDDLLMFCFLNECTNIEMKPCPDQPELSGLISPED